MQKTGFKDWKLNEIKQGDILETQQGNKFIVEFSYEHDCWSIIQCNAGNTPELQGTRFSIEHYMQPNLEVVGSIYSN